MTTARGPSGGPGWPARPLDALRGFFDDASLFPPASTPLPAAVASHRAHQAAWYAPLVGAFVCSWPRVKELAAVAAPEPVPVSLTLPNGPADLAPALAECARLEPVHLTGVEVKLPDGMAADQALRMMDDLVPASVTGYLEVPLGRLPQALDVLAASRFRAKLRTGGLDAAAHPTEAELAHAVRAVVRHGLPFKCTAGLHHAIRHTEPPEPTGSDGPLEQHGFLNILLAVDRARLGADAATIAAELSSRSADSIRNGIVEVAAAGRLADVRTNLVAIGTCSISDPIADLVALDLAQTP